MNNMSQKNSLMKDKANLNLTTTSGLGLRSSNSFTNLFESHRNKSPTPTRLGSLAINSLGKKNSI